MDTQLFGDCTGHGTAIVSCVYFTTLQPGQSWTMSGTVHYPDSVGTAKVGVVAWSPGTEPASDPHPNTVIQEVSVDTTSVVDVGPVGWEYAPGGTARVGQTVFSYNTTFHYGGPVSGLTVSQTIPAGFTIGAAQLIWDEELDDFSVVRHTGTCSLSGRTVTCTADATVIYGTDPMMSVALTPLAPGTFTIGHAASSPHPERTHQRIRWCRRTRRPTCSRSPTSSPRSTEPGSPEATPHRCSPRGPDRSCGSEPSPAPSTG